MIAEKEIETVTPGLHLAEQTRQWLVEEMRQAIATQNWERLARAVDAYSRIVK